MIGCSMMGLWVCQRITRRPSVGMAAGSGDPRRARSHGYGLGLSGLDQTKPEVAILAMQRRIQVIFDKYLDLCAGNKCNNPTNDFLLSAMAGNGITIQDVITLYGSRERIYGVFNWEAWLGADELRWKVLQDFVNHWAWLESQGFELPEGILWDKVCQLLKNHQSAQQ
jgi:hypothetical protein